MTAKLVKSATNDGQITKSELSDGAEQNYFHRWLSSATIGSSLKIIWVMSAERKITEMQQAADFLDECKDQQHQSKFKTRGKQLV